MNLLTQPEVLAEYQPIIGVIIAAGVDNSKTLPEVGKLLDEAAEQVRTEFAKLEAPTKHPFIAAWRQAMARTAEFFSTYLKD